MPPWLAGWLAGGGGSDPPDRRSWAALAGTHDLEHVSVKSARVIIVLSPAYGESGKTHAADEADGYVLRVLLCLGRGPALGELPHWGPSS